MLALPSLPFWKKDTVETKEKVFHSGKHKIVYEVVGSGPPLLMIHGLSGSGKWWRNNLPAFSEKYTCHVLELVGYGGNRALRPLRLEDAAAAIAAFITTELPVGKAHVIGHSMGGQIASYLAARFPERVDKLVLAAASGLVRSDLVRMAMRLPVAGHYSPLDFLPTLAMDALRAGPVNLLLSTMDILGSDTTEILKTVKVPTLLVFGDRDNLVPVAAGEAMKALIPDSRLEVIEGAGHVLMWDHPKTFNKIVLDFLAQNPAPGIEVPQDTARSGDKPADSETV